MAEFIGYYLSYETFSAGLSPKRVKWVLEWIGNAEKNNWYVTGRGFSEFLGRLNFVARLLSWIRPFLAPLFAFNAVLRRGTVARLPAMAFISLCYVRDELKSSNGLQSVKQTWLAPRESFRTDAKCETGRVVLGGWSTKAGLGLDPVLSPWFSLKVFPSDLPCLFKDGESGWASTSAELLASLAALVAFGHLAQPIPGAQDCMQVFVCGETDNRSTPEVQRKGLSNKWPLFGIQMAASKALRKVNKRLMLNWRPREENTWADDLTNGDFHAFDPKRRVKLTFAMLPLGLRADLDASRAEFIQARATLVSLKTKEAAIGRREKEATKTAW